MVNALEELSLVSRNEHPTDGRQVLVEITEAGERTLNDARNRRTEWLARRLATLTADDRQVLRQAAEILQRMSAK
jgi:DNA-binding MarR family transcriptional regulator